MFDDGYDYFCFNFVSLFERNPSSSKHDIGTYCGCVDHLEKAKDDPVSGDIDEALSEPA